MTWIESHLALGAHPKTKRLARHLGIGKPQAVGHLWYLWWWAFEYAPSGHLSGFWADEIADAAQWEGDAEAFWAALIESGFVDDDGRLHDWDEYAGKYITRRKADAERKRVGRAAMSRERPMDIQRTSDGRRTESIRRGEKRREEKTTTPLPPSPSRAPMNGSSSSDDDDFIPAYAKTLGKTMTKVVGEFRILDVGITEGWLKTILVEAERDIGPLPRDKLQHGLHIAYSGLERAIAAERSGGKKIGSIRGLTRSVILESLKEQADVHVA